MLNNLGNEEKEKFITSKWLPEFYLPFAINKSKTRGGKNRLNLILSKKIKTDL